MGDGSEAHRWEHGVYWGLCKLTGQYRLFRDGMLRFARTVKRVPNPDKWCSDRLQQVSLTPWKLHNPKTDEVIFKKKVDAEAEAKQAQQDILRKIKRAPITRSDLDDFGHTAGCPNATTLSGMVMAIRR